MIDPEDLPDDLTREETEKDLQKTVNEEFDRDPTLPELENGKIITPNKTFIGSKKKHQVINLAYVCSSLL